MPYIKIPRIDADAVLARIQAEGPDALLTRGEAAALVAARTMGAHDTRQTARNRVGMQLDRAAKRGREGHDIFTGAISRLTDGRMTADELRRWGNAEYGPIFNDLPRGAPRGVLVNCVENVNLAGQGPDAFMVPGDPVRKDEMIHRLHAALNDLKAAAVADEAERRRKLAARLNRKH